MNCPPAYLTYIQSTSCKILDWMKHKLESRLLGEILITSDMQMTKSEEAKKFCLMAESEEELKSLMMKSEREEQKSWVKAQHSEN